MTTVRAPNPDLKYTFEDTEARFDEALERDRTYIGDKKRFGSLVNMALEADMPTPDGTIDVVAAANHNDHKAAASQNASVPAGNIVDLDRYKPNITLTRMPAREFIGVHVGSAKLFPKDAMTIFTALGGTGKTTALLSMASHISAGKSWNYEGLKSSRVMYFAMEEVQDELSRKVGAAIQRWTDAEKAAVEANLRVISLVGQDPRLTRRIQHSINETPLLTHVINMAKTFDAELIILDHLQGFADGDLNNSDTATALASAVNKIVAATGAAVVLAAHVNKSQIKAEEVAAGFTTGSLAFENAARQVIGVIRPSAKEAEELGLAPDHEVMKIVISKNSYGRAGEYAYIEREYVPDFHTITVRPLVPPLQASRGIVSKEDRLKADIVDYLTKHPYRSKKNLEDLAGKDGRFKVSRNDVRKTVQTLIDDGVIKLGEIPDNERAQHSIPHQVKEGLAVCP